MDQSARFALPFLAPGQNQKEWFHNEALQRVDMLLCPVAEGAPQAAPPPSPALGSCYLVATGGSGAWAGQDGALACFTEAGWKLVAPIEGMRVLDRSTGQMMLRREGAWESGVVRAQQLRISGQVVVGPRQAAIPDPAGGSVVDAECRTALAAVLAALRAHGLIG